MKTGGFYPTVVINDPDATVVESETYGTISLQQYLTNIATQQSLPNLLVNSNGFLGLANWNATGWNYTLIDGYRQSGGFVCNLNSSTSTLSQSINIGVTNVTLQLSFFVSITTGNLSITIDAYENSTLLGTILNESNFSTNQDFSQYTFTTQPIPENATNVVVTFSVTGASSNTLIILSQILLTTSNILTIWNNFDDLQCLINKQANLNINSIITNDITASSTATLPLTGFILPNAAGTLILAPGMNNSSSGLQLNWNLTNGVGELDFINLSQGSVGGFNFYTYNDTGILTTLGEWLNNNSGFTVNTNFSAPNISTKSLTASSTATLPLTGFIIPSAAGTLTLAPGITDSTPGLQLNWNLSNNGNGEIDFINLSQGGVGGFNFYTYNSSGTLTTLGEWLNNSSGFTINTNFSAPGISTANIAYVGTVYLDSSENNIGSNYATAYKDIENRLYNICNYTTNITGPTSNSATFTFAIAFNHIDTVYQGQYEPNGETTIGYDSLSNTQITISNVNASSSNYNMYNLSTIMGR